MEFRVLGAIEGRRDGVPVVLGSFKQRSLLALLLIHANEVVSTDRIIDELWGDHAAAGRQNALWVHVSNLRSALEPARAKRAGGTVLATRVPGYVLEVGAEELDAWRFERLVLEARGLVETDPAAASVVCGEALALWRGHAYADVTYESFAQPEIARLEELRLQAVELRIDADLRRGLAGELTGELEALTAQHPFRERMTAQWMLALYRAGRQAEALRAYQRLRARLADDLGVEPSPAVRELEARIVTGDPALAPAPARGARSHRPAVRGYELREVLRAGAGATTYRAYQPLIGREVALRIIPCPPDEDAAFAHRFEHDTQLLRRVAHPHIAPIEDHWREDGAAYVVTALVEGDILADLLSAGTLEPALVARVARDVGSALAAAHGRGVVHGDVTPASIVVGGDRVVLADFGLGAGDGSSTAAGDVAGLAAAIAGGLGGGGPGGPALAELPAMVRPSIEQAMTPGTDGGYSDVAAFVEDLLAALGAGGAGMSEEIRNPYKGLRAFAEVDEEDFFGRERLVERLVARLADPGPRGRFVAVVGASGCGKSSVVRGGVLPALRRGAVPGSAGWLVADLHPGRDPFDELAAALHAASPKGGSDVLADLQRAGDGLGRAALAVLGDGGSQLLVVVDQFEELFTQTDEATAQRFLATLVSAVSSLRSRVRVLVTLRADFYDRPLEHRGIGELLRQGTEVVTPMSPDEVERAVTAPAELVGVRFESGLVAQIVADVAEHPGALPLLQFALTELFERRRHHLLEVAAYRDIGGLSAAVGHRAERLWEGFDAGARAAAHQVMLRLVTIGEGTEDVRRRVLRTEVVALHPGSEQVLEAFGAHRLLSFDRDPLTRGPTVELAHEALLREWPRLRRWVDDAREDIRQERRLGAVAAEWRRGGRQHDDLLRGSQVGHFAAWAAGTDLVLDQVEREFLDASVVHRAEEEASEHRRRHRELQLHRQKRARTWLLAIGGVVLAVVAALGALVVDQRREADRLAVELAAISEAQRLAASSTLAAGEDPAVALLLALQSLHTSATAGIPAGVEAEEALHWALQAAQVPYPDSDAPVEARFGPSGMTGIYRLPLDELAALARAGLDGRTLTAADCARHAISPCPPRGERWPWIPADPVRPVLTAHDASPLAGTRVSIVGETARRASPTSWSCSNAAPASTSTTSACPRPSTRPSRSPRRCHATSSSTPAVPSPSTPAPARSSTSVLTSTRPTREPPSETTSSRSRPSAPATTACRCSPASRASSTTPATPSPLPAMPCRGRGTS